MKRIPVIKDADYQLLPSDIAYVRDLIKEISAKTRDMNEKTKKHIEVSVKKIK